MRRKVLQSRASRALARVLVAAQVLSAIPAQAAADPAPPVPAAATTVDPLAPPATAPPPPPQVAVNRMVPRVDPPQPYAVFSPSPSPAEITRARVFGEPLFPIGGTPTPQENQDLAAAVMAFQFAGDVENVTPFGSFLVEHPNTPWRASLLMNLGVLYRSRGFFTRATKVLHEAWALAKDREEPGAEATAYRAMGELLDIRSQFGQLEPLQALLADLGGRPLRGDLTGRVAIAQFTVGVLTDHHELACPSGPQALERIRVALGLAGPQAHPEIQAFPASHEGADLAQMAELSERVGLRMRMAHRAPGAPLPLPAMVHLKQKHFSAVTKLVNGRYLLSDPFLGGEVWISQAALDEEASGYFLVLDGPLSAGWRSVDATEARVVKGKCGPQTPPDRNTGPPCSQTGGGCPPGMGLATYSFHRVLANLHITDTPVGYTPPRGPAVQFQINNNHRESYQPQTFTYSNFGQKWVFDWMAYVQDDPGSPGGTVTLFTRGGGSTVYLGVTGAGSTPETIGRSQLVLVSTSPVVYERRNTDGSVEVYAQPDGAMTVPRRVFMTQAKDPQGNALTFAYDTQMRLVSVTDAIGQVSTLGYEMSADPLKITKVTDPFGRSARFEYDATGRLSRITDVIGMQSSFTYGILNFIQSMTTPYGTTLFNIGLDNWNGQWWAQATDPLGGTERIHYGSTGTMPGSEPASAVPLGFTNNAALNAGASYYWDKRAWALHPGDFTKAHTMKWRVDSQTNRITDVLASEKKPLENRVWYDHVGGPTPNSVGSTGRPARIGRVLDDGASQVYQYEYNSKGKVTRQTDPLGRETVFEYDTNEIDLLRAKQKNGSNYDLLWSATYNGQHRRLTVTDASGSTWTNTYNTQGQRLTTTTPARAGITENRTTTYSYDTNGYLQNVTGPATGATTAYTYDAFGRVRTAMDSDSYTLTTDYDALDRPTRVTYPDGTYEETVFNRLDPEKRRDRLGRWSHTFYDALRRVVATRDPLGRTTTQQWCTCGSLDKLIDANGNATTWQRDVQGRVSGEVRADASSTTFVYENTTSRLKQRTDAENQTTGYEYFTDNELKQITYTNPQNPTRNVSYTYDSIYRRLSTRQEGSDLWTYSYHPVTTSPTLGAAKLAGLDGPLSSDTLGFTYDELGRVKTRTLSAATTTWNYDVLGRVTSEQDSLGTFTYGYDGVTDRVLSLTYPNNQVTTYGYLGNLGDHRLTEVHNKRSSGATLSKFNYTTDPANRLNTWTQQADSDPAKVYEYGYNQADELTSAVLKSTAVPPTILKSYGYGYDNAGNRTAEQVDQSVTSASYSTLNRLQSHQSGGPLRFAGTLSEVSTVTVQGQPAQVTADNRFEGPASVSSGTNTVAVVATDPSANVRTNTYEVTASGAAKTFAHDGNGNLTGDGVRTFEWDAENRLVALNQGTLRSEFTYDGEGFRTRIVEKDGSTVLSDRRYVWCDTELCEERDATGATVLKRFFSSGLQEGSDAYFYAQDHLGSVREMTDASGAVRARYDYDPYGRMTKLSGDKDSPFGFTGHFVHSAGLALAPYRAYDASLGRWISEDPIGLGGGLNLYGYVSGNPIRSVDPLGLQEPEPQPKPPPKGPPPSMPPTTPRQPPAPKNPPATRLPPPGGGWRIFIPPPPPPGLLGPILVLTLFCTAANQNEEDPEEERCKEVRKKCWKECKERFPDQTTVHPAIQNQRFRDCLKTCISLAGCTKP